jgi:AAA15 family ATPase/GTPase
MPFRADISRKVEIRSMLCNFTISNFRSIGEEITLSMSGGRYKETDHGIRAIKTGFPQFPCALRAAAIYGANAAGKSSIVAAIDFLQDLVSGSARDEKGGHLATLPYCKYLGDKKDEGRTFFEVSFIEIDVTYTYGVTINKETIFEEWLHAKTKKGRVREIFSRSKEGEEREWHFSNFFSSKKMTKTWANATRDNALFLSTAIQLNCEELEPVHRWLTRRLRVVTASNLLGSMVTSRHAHEHEGDRARLIELLRMADPTIVDISVEARDLEDSDIFGVFNDEVRARLVEAIERKVEYDVKITHRLKGGRLYKLDLEEESDGTQVMYRYAAPFLQSIDHNLVVIVDELDRSLHPLLLEYIVSIFTTPDDLQTSAQIVFTTHDSALLSSDVLARDQIWFVENEMNGTFLTPLADYHPRKNDLLQKSYLQGRYKAIPSSRIRMLSSGK